jgi:Na+/proline symporter
VTALSLYFVFGVGSLAQPHIVHKFYMLRDPRRLKWYPALMTGAMLLTLLLFVGVGLGTRAAVARGALPPLASPDDATPAFLFAFTPAWLTGVVLSGVAAAIMSTVNSFLSIGAAAITSDLPARAPGAAPSLRAGRVATVALAVVAAAAAQASGTLVAFLGVFGYGLFAAALVPALGIGLNWPGATAPGAIASILTGTTITLVGETLGYLGVVTLPRGAALAGVSLVASTLVFVAVSWATRARAAADLDDDIRLILET